MGSHGHSHPAAPMAGPGVPILGQPFVLKGWFPTIQLVCNCGAHEPVLIVGGPGSAGHCPACKKAFVYQGLQMDPVTQQLQLNIGMGLLEEPGPKT